MIPSEIKTALAKLGGGANKKLGQHFLIDKSALEAIVDAADVKKGDRVLEIGPGLGVLTDALSVRGADIVAIEQDRRFIPSLIRANRRIVHGDAATVHWHELIEDLPDRQAGGPWKFVSNLPYSITSLALRKALWGPKPPEVVVVLVQREVAERAVAKDGKTSLLSLMVSLASESSRIVKRVPPGAFYPPPKVESAILQIVPMPVQEREKRWGMDPEKIMAIAKRGFAHPRKLLASNLGVGGDVLRNADIPEKARPENLSPDEWAKLARVIMAP